jgi:hypothetical protein
MTKKPQTIEPFVMHRREMLQSPAWRALSRAGRQFIDRLEIEQCNHGGADNGKLPCTADDFIAYGIDKETVGPAQREVIALGFVRLTKQGFAGKGARRQANEFELTYLPTGREQEIPATDLWRSIETFADAKLIATAARAKRPVKRDGFQWITDPEKPIIRTRKNRDGADPEKPLQTPEIRTRKNRVSSRSSSHKR